MPGSQPWNCSHRLSNAAFAIRTRCVSMAAWQPSKTGQPSGLAQVETWLPGHGSLRRS